MTQPSDHSTEETPDPSAPAPSAWPDVFGNVLPDQTGDELADGSEWRDDEDDHDERLRREVPPHH